MTDSRNCIGLFHLPKSVWIDNGVTAQFIKLNVSILRIEQDPIREFLTFYAFSPTHFDPVSDTDPIPEYALEVDRDLIAGNPRGNLIADRDPIAGNPRGNFIFKRVT